MRPAALVFEQVLLEAVEGDRPQKPGGHDAIGVDVVAPHGQARALNPGNAQGLHYRAPTDSCTKSRTSTTSPAIAAAATIAGLMSNVRPVGLPWRPLKLRLDDEAQTWRPSSRSGFMPRHIEQPAPRHSNPAVMNTSCSPRASAAWLTARDPGTTSAFTCGATRCPLTRRAASSRSERRPFVHEPMNATSIFVPATRAPGRNPMNANASSCGSPAIVSPMPTDCTGLMPQVTVGSIARASTVTRSS